jgi:hypothetical protein
MLDFILLTLFSVGLLYFKLNVFVVGGIAVVVGLLWGGLDFVFKMVFVALATAIAPFAFALWQGVPVSIVAIGLNAFALTLGYVLGSLLSAVLFPVKILGKIVKGIAGIFKR